MSKVHRIVGLFVGFALLFFGQIAFAQESAKPSSPQEQVKITRDVKVTIGQPGV